MGKFVALTKERFLWSFPRNLWQGNFKIERGLNFFCLSRRYEGSFIRSKNLIKEPLCIL
jgi:hypothetical protein